MIREYFYGKGFMCLENRSSLFITMYRLIKYEFYVLSDCFVIGGLATPNSVERSDLISSVTITLICLAFFKFSVSLAF